MFTPMSTLLCHFWTPKMETFENAAGQIQTFENDDADTHVRCLIGSYPSPKEQRQALKPIWYSGQTM